MRYAAGAAYLARRRTPWVALVVALLVPDVGRHRRLGSRADTQALQGFAPVSLDQADRYDVVYAVNEDGRSTSSRRLTGPSPPTRSGTASIARCRSAPDTGIRRRSIATTR